MFWSGTDELWSYTESQFSTSDHICICLYINMSERLAISFFPPAVVSPPSVVLVVVVSLVLLGFPAPVWVWRCGFCTGCSGRRHSPPQSDWSDWWDTFWSRTVRPVRPEPLPRTASSTHGSGRRHSPTCTPPRWSGASTVLGVAPSEDSKAGWREPAGPDCLLQMNQFSTSNLNL